MGVFIWYLVKSDLSYVGYCTRVHWTSHFLQVTRNTGPCIICKPVPYFKCPNNRRPLPIFILSEGSQWSNTLRGKKLSTFLSVSGLYILQIKEAEEEDRLHDAGPWWKSTNGSTYIETCVDFLNIII